MGDYCGSVNVNSIALNRQDGQGAAKPNCATGKDASHEYKPPKPAESKVPMPK